MKKKARLIVRVFMLYEEGQKLLCSSEKPIHAFILYPLLHNVNVLCSHNSIMVRKRPIPSLLG